MKLYCFHWTGCCLCFTKISFVHLLCFFLKNNWSQTYFIIIQAIMFVNFITVPGGITLLAAKVGSILPRTSITDGSFTFQLSGRYLTLSTLVKNFSRRQFEIFFPENRLWHFMQILSSGDSLQEMSNPVFWEKNKKNITNVSFAELVKRLVKGTEGHD